MCDICVNGRQLKKLFAEISPFFCIFFLNVSLTDFIWPFFRIIRPCRLQKLQKNVKKIVIEGRHKDWPYIFLFVRKKIQ